MSLNETPSSERIHIGIFGKQNAGKSSLINAITGQHTALVSEQKGTTTDPVYKAMELLPLGPVVLMDTPGLDDRSELGELRTARSREALKKADLALVVIDAARGTDRLEEELMEELRKQETPFLIVYNKSDLKPDSAGQGEGGAVWVSACTGQGIKTLKEKMAHMIPVRDSEKRLVGDLLKPHDTVVLVVPIDKSAPKGRLILPQQQTIRDVLEAGAVSVVVRDTELRETLARFPKKPRLVITDSQVFERVNKETPQEIPLTSFSILFARYKGNLLQLVQGVQALESLKDGDRILIAEGCTHHRQCEDIGTVKLPHWIKEYTGKEPEFVFASGKEFPQSLEEYGLIVHCGGCMLQEREMQNRLKQAAREGVPVTNYGILIAGMKGILKRSLEPFPETEALRNGDAR